MAEANPADEIVEEKAEELDGEEELLARHRKEKKDIQGSLDFQRNCIFLGDICLFIYFLLIVIYSNSKDSSFEEDSHKRRQKEKERRG